MDNSSKLIAASGDYIVPHRFAAGSVDSAVPTTGFKKRLSFGPTIAFAAVASSASNAEAAAAALPDSSGVSSTKPSLSDDIWGRIAYQELSRMQAMVASERAASVKAMHRLDARIEALTSVVTRLAQQADFSGGDWVDPLDAGAEPAAILDRASDAGLVDATVLALAEQQLIDGDRVGKLAAIRAIGLADEARGAALLQTALEEEKVPFFRRVIEDALKAYG